MGAQTNLLFKGHRIKAARLFLVSVVYTEDYIT